MKTFTRLVAMAALGAAAVASAAEIEVWHGWMNLTPCTKVEWGNDGLFGLPSPTYREGPQELHGWIYADVTTGGELANQARNDCAQCGIQAAAVASAASILTEGAGGWPAFTGAFWGCLSSRAETYNVVRSVNLKTDTFCRW